MARCLPRPAKITFVRRAGWFARDTTRSGTVGGDGTGCGAGTAHPQQHARAGEGPSPAGPAEPRAVLTVLCGTKPFPSRIAPPAPSQLPPSAGALQVLWSLPFPDPFPASPTRPGAFCTEYLNEAQATVTPAETRQSLGAPSGLNPTAARSTRASGWEMRGWLRAPAFPSARRTLLPVGHQQPCPRHPRQGCATRPRSPARCPAAAPGCESRARAASRSASRPLSHPPRALAARLGRQRKTQSLHTPGGQAREKKKERKKATEQNSSRFPNTIAASLIWQKNGCHFEP